MTRFGLLSEGHLLVFAGHHASKEAFGFFADALPAFAAGHPPSVLLLAVLPQPDLTHNALKQVPHIVMQRGRRLDELTVKHHGTGTALCRGEESGEEGGDGKRERDKDV